MRGGDLTIFKKEKIYSYFFFKINSINNANGTITKMGNENSASVMGIPYCFVFISKMTSQDANKPCAARLKILERLMLFLRKNQGGTSNE